MAPKWLDHWTTWAGLRHDVFQRQILVTHAHHKAVFMVLIDLSLTKTDVFGTATTASAHHPRPVLAVPSPLRDTVPVVLLMSLDVGICISE